MCCPHKCPICYTCNSVVRKPDAYFMFIQHTLVFNIIFYSHISSDDDNRIVLKPLSDCQNDYINASYVDVRIHSLNNYWTLKITLIVYVHLFICMMFILQGYESFHKFIACQGKHYNYICVMQRLYYMLRFEKTLNQHDCAVTACTI